MHPVAHPGAPAATPAPACPRFSVVIPTYNRPAQLHQCLAALRRQAYPADALEIIIVDDGSPRPLDDVVAAHPGVRLIRQANAGPAAARNTGAAAARHPFLAFTDDDCAPHPQWLVELAAVLAEDPHVLVGGQCINALPDNPCSAASQMILDVVNDHFNHDREHATFFASDNMAMAREHFLAVGGFDPAFRCSEDRDLCDRWSAAGRRLVYRPQALVDHAHHMGLGGFWRQHLGYGRGAWNFHRARAQRHSGSLQVAGGFYGKCFREPFRRHSLRRALPLAGLMCIWQAANTAGFVTEALKRRPRAARAAISAE